MIVAHEGGDYTSPPLSPWQREQSFRITSPSGAVIEGGFLDGADGASYGMLYRTAEAGGLVRVFVRAGADPVLAARALRAMASELEGKTLER